MCQQVGGGDSSVISRPRGHRRFEGSPLLAGVERFLRDGAACRWSMSGRRVTASAPSAERPVGYSHSVPRGRVSSPALAPSRSAEGECGLHERSVGERLGIVAQMPVRRRIDLLGIQAQ